MNYEQGHHNGVHPQNGYDPRSSRGYNVNPNCESYDLREFPPRDQVARVSSTSGPNRRRLQSEPETDNRIPVVLPAYRHPPRWLPKDMRTPNSEYELEMDRFMPRRVQLLRKNGEGPFGFHIRGGLVNSHKLRLWKKVAETISEFQIQLELWLVHLFSSEKFTCSKMWTARERSDNERQRERLQVYQVRRGSRVLEGLQQTGLRRPLFPLWLQRHSALREVCRHFANVAINGSQLLFSHLYRLTVVATVHFA